MKINLVLVTAIIGVIVLFFFPSPEENFITYLGTILLFGLVIFILIKFKYNKH